MNSSYMLITGGLGGLGTAFAGECAQRGNNLLLIDRHNGADDILIFLQERYPIDVQYMACDLADPEARKALLEEIQQRELVFSGLINVVGQEFEGPFLDRSREELLHMLQLNLGVMVDLTHAILRQRDETQRFHLVNVASLAAFFPMPYKAVYAATKRFILHFSLALRKEIEDFGNVTVLCPAGLPTNPESMKKIFLQGFWGKMTAQDPSVVVKKTMDCVQRNIPIYIPGFSNKLMVFLARFLPESWLVGFLCRRWGNQLDNLDLWRLTQEQRSKQTD